MRISLIAILVFAWPANVAGQQSPGFYVETRTTVVSTGGTGRPTTRVHLTRSWSSTECSRTEGDVILGDSTAYRLVRGRPSRVVSVVPRDRVVLTTDTAGARRIVATAVKLLGPMPSIAGYRLLGEGGTILGHKTHKYELRTTTRSTSAGREIASAPTVTTFWIADDSTDPMVAAHRATRPKIIAGEVVGTGRGKVLRSETRAEWLRDVEQVTTREVLVWRKEAVPASRCVLPEGYRSLAMTAYLQAKASALADLRRLSKSSDPADRARARALGDSLFKEIQRTQLQRSMRDDPSAVVIDGGKKKP